MINPQPPKHDFASTLCVSSVFGQAMLSFLFFGGWLSFEFARFVWSWLFLVMLAAFIAGCIARWNERRK